MQITINKGQGEKPQVWQFEVLAVLEKRIIAWLRSGAAQGCDTGGRLRRGTP